MRIAVWHNLPSGGAKRALYYQVRELVKRGHYLEAWCPSTADPSYLPLRELVTEHVKPFAWHPRPQPHRVARFVADYADPIDRLDALKRHWQHTADEINQGKFDLLFANACWMLGVSAVGRYVRFPKIVYLPEPYRPLYEAMPRLPWLAAEPEPHWYSPRPLKNVLRDLMRVQALRVQAREELANAKAFDLILVNSFYTRESILRTYGLDAQVCYLGIDTELFAPLARPKEDFILGVGNFFPHKNIELVLRAVAIIPAPRPRVVWVGNLTSAYLDAMIELAQALEVDFTPKLMIGDHELVELYNRATLLAYAPRLEPFGFAPLEANACGTPVVAVAEGGVRETVMDQVNGLIVEADPSKFAQAIQRLINEPAFAQQLGDNGRRLVAEKWSIEASINRLESIFERQVSCKASQFKNV